MSPFSGSSTAPLEHAVGTWTLTGQTTAGFSVSNFGFKRVNGTIPVTSAQFEVTDAGAVDGVIAVLNIASMDTGIAKRDSDLRKPGLLDLDNHPQLSFTSQQVLPRERGWTVIGLLTVKGVTREISLDVNGEQSADGVLGVRLTGQLDRRDYGIKAPRFMIGTLVDIQIEATFGR